MDLGVAELGMFAAEVYFFTESIDVFSTWL
jgi:hypothetical protein